MFATLPASAPQRTLNRPPLNSGPTRRARTFDLRRYLGKVLVSGLVAGLALLHGQLLWQRIASYTLLEPLVALRWGVAMLVLAGFVYLRRAGISVVLGHKALILWLLVLLVHVGTVVPAEGHQPLAEPGLLLAVSLWSFALRAILGELDRLAGGRIPCFARILPAGRPPALPRDPELAASLYPRPPPAG